MSSPGHAGAAAPVLVGGSGHSDSRRLILGLLVFGLVNSIALPLVLQRGFSNAPAYAHGIAFLSLKPTSADSWRPMRRAYAEAVAGGGNLYQTLFFDERVKFIYPPTSLLIIAALSFGPLATFIEAHGWSADDVLQVISWCFVALSAFFVARILITSVERSRRLSRLDVAGLALTGVFFTLTYYPIMKAYTLGQAQVWINALFAAAFWCWLTGKEGVAGYLVGLMCLLKPQYALILVWGLLRRRWEFVVRGALTAGLALALSVGIFGWSNHVGYLQVLSFLSRHGEAFYPNQSFNGLLNRLFHNGDSANWSFSVYPPFHPVVYAGTLIASALLLLAALFLPTRSAEKGGVADLSIMTLSCTLASPVAWEHHFGVLLPVCAWLVASSDRRSWPLLALGFVSTSNFLDVLNRLGPTPLNFMQSYVLAGACLVLGLLYRVPGRTGGAAIPS